MIPEIPSTTEPLPPEEFNSSATPRRPDSTMENMKIAEKILEDARTGKLPKPAPRVSSLSICRLYNLGNYEHVKYEISVDVPNGADAGAALRKLARIMQGLRPHRLSVTTLHNHQKLVENPDSFRYAYGDTLEYRLQAAKEYIAEYESAQQRINESLRMLNDLGGTETITDTKDFWAE